MRVLKCTILFQGKEFNQNLLYLFKIQEYMSQVNDTSSYPVKL